MGRIRKPVPPLPQFFLAQVEKLYLAGNSVENCANELRTTPLQCKRALTQAGTPLRSRGQSVRAYSAIRGVCRQTTARSDRA